MNVINLNLTQCKNINSALETIVENGIEPKLSYSSTYGFVLNLDFETKANVSIILDDEYSDDTGIMTVDRYNDKEFVTDLNDILYLFKDKYSTKGFGNKTWIELAVANGVMEKNVEEVVTYK